jgi:hypothetical protein
MNREERERVGHLLQKDAVLKTPTFTVTPGLTAQVFLGYLPGQGDLYFVDGPALVSRCDSGQMVLLQYGNRLGQYQSISTPESYVLINKRVEENAAQTYALRCSSRFRWYGTAMRLATKKKLYKGKFA